MRSMQRVMMLGGVLLLVLTALMAWGHRQQPSGYILALADERYQGSYVVRVAPDGSNPATLFGEQRPILSSLQVTPDHRHLTLTALHGADLVPSWWMVSLTGTVRQRLPAPAYPDALPSPDGQWLLIQRRLILYRVPADDSAPPHDIFNERGVKDNLAWTHDGRWVVFRLNDTRPTLYRVRPDGSEAAPIVDDGQAVSHVAWSPLDDGVVYGVLHETPTGRTADLYRVQVDGSGRQRLNADPLPPISRLAWSPDGAWVLVMTADASGAGVERGLLRLNTADWTLTTVPVTTRSLLIDELGWSPDNRALVIVSWGSLYRLDLDTGRLVTLQSAYLVEHRSPVWAVPSDARWHQGGLALVGILGIAGGIWRKR